MNERDEQVIKYYQEQEKEMILLFAQWCINHNLDPKAVYQEAYPMQPINTLLEEVLKDTIDANESDTINHELLLQVLQAFGNDDLAFVVAQYGKKTKK
ncbi:hypothetical protein BN1058_02662 [Paraliobacillus sp. PM-2]|uniref:hypothetical protein n=1 Tax=Paraliobacillus sp. PM-2 TaxID=1462524 RepID=UPI00061C49A6|nr:hypothetical protein [Paraliobacillus sp. PM-2]CQR48297.1 hypothetical protein BN1058_02662 [Paraliobacillus sp. PM-2]